MDLVGIVSFKFLDSLVCAQTILENTVLLKNCTRAEFTDQHYLFQSEPFFAITKISL